MSGSKVEYTPKTVIENKLLAALEQEGNVAIIATLADLDLLIFALSLDFENPRRSRFLADLRKLRAGAFPDAK